MQTEGFLLAERLRGETYKFLSECYYLPSPALIEMLDSLEERLGSVCAEACRHVSRMKEELAGATDLDEMKIDYARLFVGPYELLAPPYGSVYLDTERRVMGDSTLEARKMYRDVGVDVADAFRDLPDHIAAELEFMHFLIFKEIEAITRCDANRAMDYLEKQQVFLEKHLAAWVPRFVQHVVKSDSTEFYKHLAKATELFINSECNEALAFVPESRHGETEDCARRCLDRRPVVQ